MTLDDGPWERMSDDKPLEHSVLDAGLNSRPVAPVLPPLQCSAMAMDLEREPWTGDGGPPVGPEHDLTLSDGPHATGIVDWIPDGPVPLPAVEVGRVALSPADECLQAGDENTVVVVVVVVVLLPMDALRRDFSFGIRTVMFKISTRHLMVCQCIMAMICMIRRIRIGMTRSPLLVRHT